MNASQVSRHDISLNNIHSTHVLFTIPSYSSSSSLLVICRHPRWIIGIPGKLIKQPLIVRRQRRTLQIQQYRRRILIHQRQRGGDIAQERLQRIRKPRLHRLDRKAAKVVALKQVGRVVGAPSQVADVDAGEGVHGPGVAADFKRVWVLLDAN